MSMFFCLVSIIFVALSGFCESFRESILVYYSGFHFCAGFHFVRRFWIAVLFKCWLDSGEYVFFMPGEHYFCCIVRFSFCVVFWWIFLLFLSFLFSFLSFLV